MREEKTNTRNQADSQAPANIGKLQDIKVSVIIPTRNNPRKIEQNIQALLSGSICPCEVIVSDQSDNDDTEYISTRFDSRLPAGIVRYIRQSRTGLSANRNDALKYTSGDFILFVDDDVVVSKHCIALMLAEWVEQWNYDPVVITGRILPAPEFKSADLVTALRQVEARMVFHGKPQMNGVLIGAYFGGSKALFEQFCLSPFDENLGLGARYPAAEDDEFAYCVLKKGIPIVYEPDIFVTHHTKRVSGWRRMRYLRAIGSGGAFAKHILLGDYGLVINLFQVIAINLKKSIYALVRFNEPEGTSRLFASIGLLYGFARWVLDAALDKLIKQHDSGCNAR